MHPRHAGGRADPCTSRNGVARAGHGHGDDRREPVLFGIHGGSHGVTDGGVNPHRGNTNWFAALNQRPTAPVRGAVGSRGAGPQL